MRDVVPRSAGVEYTSIDLNTTGTTTVYDGDREAIIHGVYAENSGGTLEVQLEITDGTDTTVLTLDQGAGDGIAFETELELDPSNDLQLNVTTGEGAIETTTAAVIRSEY